MKKTFLTIFGIVLFFAACTQCTSKGDADLMAKDICSALDLLSDDPMSMLEVSSAIINISEDSLKYGKVYNEDLLSALEKSHPECAEKYKSLFSQ